MAAKRHISKDDLFALLNEFGGSIAGAVTLRRRDETSKGNPAYEPLSDRALEAKRGSSILRRSAVDVPAARRTLR
jgi:serine/threonine-protein kinase HipA